MAREEDVDIGPGADVEMEDDPSIRKRGRGFDPRADGPSNDGVKHVGNFEKLNLSSEAQMDQDESAGQDEHEEGIERPAQSIEGYIIIVTGIDEEATEEEVIEKFADFGKVQNCHLNLDRRTGYVKGYALLEFRQLEEAKEAIAACKDGLTLMDKELKAGFAFVQPPPTHLPMGIRGAASRGNATRNRSRSPDRR
ncbi:RNA-binding domain-containing protein [Meira miltonrushii]|uniref:RNA-binding domain-containing protein n=1 Tax=Meira miltonrushii TaxID=1280837 RepID=A0A316VKL4_9BASI|nr:RNA-binding domain-containing protein [Meira miltonrushii]PWN36055.1 RNA-binding domain-containing protein [Meira miltonrushii]